MILLEKKQYQAILINAIGNNDRFKFLVEGNTFKNYVGEPVGLVVKLKATVDVLETFLSVLNHEGEEVVGEVEEEVTELLTYYKNELEKARNRKEYHKKYYKEHKGE